ncbi:5-formaminoimidazole-4-carboxamide-1-(beta)-D-ribofuranosyl 5'-monophosphate synthetase [Candidatus Altiarchaeales archaeon WOR_SM1_SCG]|nr:5-formaminoimidazole-4-carboxamide-1-(beta)-D-ribofuranosyl 5'-monophosphate synthetase [Candidatus Altiarchaeales archaeon WOR_SM1_SCG]
MISHETITGILKNYDKENITIGTIGSHSALQILKGARDEGFKTLAICKNNRKFVYERFHSADEIIGVSDYREILDDDFQNKLINKNLILVPHGSLVEYVGAKNIEEKFRVPLSGNRATLEWESDRNKEKKWFKEAGIKMPKEFKSPEEIDRLVIVKFPGARGGRGYFLVDHKVGFFKKIRSRGMEDEDYTIQEYITGTRFYPHYFYSPITGEVELMSMDIRYESNVDGLARTPHWAFKHYAPEPSYTVTGNFPVVIRESLLHKVLEMGDNVVFASKKLFPPGMTGPFCIEAICTDDLKFIAFEVSARIVAGTNLYIEGSPYSQILYNEPMSTGRRIAREIKIAIEKDMLNDVIY